MPLCKEEIANAGIQLTHNWPYRGKLALRRAERPIHVQCISVRIHGESVSGSVNVVECICVGQVEV